MSTSSTSAESMPSDNLYMKGLPPGTTEETLFAMFSTLGTVVSCKVLPNPPGLEGVAALVRMGSVQEAQWILENSSQFATGLGTPSLVIRFATNAKGQGKAATSAASGGACGGAVVQPPNLHPAAPAAAAVGAQLPSSRLYMKGLPGGITEDHLKSIMAAYGTVVSAKVLSPPAGVSDSAAIVQMSSISEAQWLVDNLNGNIPQGLNSAVDVKFKTEKGDAQFGAWVEAAAGGEMGDSASETIYVTGFPSGFTEENVRLTLSSYGTARTCKVFPAPFGEAAVAAVVSMASMDEAAFLVENLNGNIPHGMTTPVEVRYADKALLAFKAAGKGQGFVQPRQPGPSSPASQRPQQQQQQDLGGGGGGGFSPDNLYMKGLPEDTTEEMLTRVFGAYGTVVSCKVLSSPPGVTSAAALVRMATPQQAKWLVENVNGNMPQGLSSPIQIRFANSSSSSSSTSTTNPQQAAAAQFAAQFSAQLASSVAQAPQLSDRAAGTPAADNLYVKGFPADATDEAVKAILAPYGSVIACRALPPPVGKFVAAALVRMRSPDEAQWLIDHLDGNIPQGQPQALEVRYAAQANAGGKAAGKGADSNGGASRWAPY